MDHLGIKLQFTSTSVMTASGGIRALTILASLIASGGRLGLHHLHDVWMNLRRSEFEKVLGSSVEEFIMSLSKGLMQSVLIVIVIAVGWVWTHD